MSDNSSVWITVVIFLVVFVGVVVLFYQSHRRLPDWVARIGRTFIQGGVMTFMFTYSTTLFKLLRDFASLGPGDELPPIPDLNFWRNMLFAIAAGGVIACGSLVWNGLERLFGKGILKPPSPPAPHNVEPVAKV